MSVVSENIQTAELFGALARAQEALFFWSPENDRLHWTTDAAQILRVADLAACETGQQLRQLYHDGDGARRDSWIAEDSGQDAFCGTYRVGNADADIWLEERLIPTGRSPSGGLCYMGLLRDVSAEQAQLNQLTYLARFDELTGQVSRSHLRTLLEDRLVAGRANAVPVCFGLVGLDNMPGLNNAFGHDIADTVLTAVGDEIERHLGSRDIIGRMSGAKFGIIFHDCPAADLEQRLLRLQAAIRDAVVDTGMGSVVVTVSVSGVVTSDSVATVPDVFAAAEDALAQTREAGGGQILIHTPDETLLAWRQNNIALADDLIAAIRENRLCLAYQPVVAADDPTRVAFHECLLRLIDRSGNLVTAGAFMPAAEKLGLVRLLDKCVIALAFGTLCAHPKVRLSVNLSPQSLKDLGWLATFDRLAEENADVLERLILEVTEATAIEDAESMAAVLNRLRSRGCAIALDDFGAGYTSFQQLKSLQLDIVKIDGSYVRNITEGKDDRFFVRTLSELAKNLDLLVVAEMVETGEAGTLLRGLGVDALQGYHYGRPDAAPDWLIADAGRQAAG